LEDTHGFKRPVQNTKQNIFPDNNQKIPIKVKRNEKLTRKKMYDKAYGDKVGSIITQVDYNSMRKKNKSKPCNNNYKIISNEARKNAGVRYYFEKNTSQIELI
jgi:Zn/Cd-binding protein ZinT